MSAVFILTPTIIAAWPAISAAVAGAAVALGFTVAREGVRAAAEANAGVLQQADVGTVELDVENCEVLDQNITPAQEIVLVKDDVCVRIRRDLRGAFKVCVNGSGRSREELQEIGERVVQKITQMYVYNKVMTELRNKGFTVVNEGLAADETVHIHVRQQVM